MHFVPGFPVMAWPMVEAELDQHYSQYFAVGARLEKSVIVYGAMEATLTPLMERIEHEHPGGQGLQPAQRRSPGAWSPH